MKSYSVPGRGNRAYIPFKYMAFSLFSLKLKGRWSTIKGANQDQPPTHVCVFDFRVLQTRLDISYIFISCEHYRKADYLKIVRHVCKHMWNMDRS